MTRPFPLTRRQAETLRYIVGYQLAHGGVSPSYGEIMRALRLPSKSTVLRLLKALAERGRIRRLPRKERAIEVLHPIAIPRAPDGAPLYAVMIPALDEKADE